MHHMKGFLAIIVSLGLALVLVPLSVAGDNGAVTVSIDAPAEVVPGSSFVANVTVSSVSDFDSCGFDVTYEESVITVTDVTGGEIDGHTILVDEWQYMSPSGGTSTVDAGAIRVVVLAEQFGCGIDGTDSIIAQIHFEAVGSGGDCSDIDLEGVGMYDYTGEPIDTTTEEGASVCIRPSVGGTAYPPNKLLMLAPWIALGAAITVGATLLVRRRRSAVR